MLLESFDKVVDLQDCNSFKRTATLTSIGTWHALSNDGLETSDIGTWRVDGLEEMVGVGRGRVLYTGSSDCAFEPQLMRASIRKTTSTAAHCAREMTSRVEFARYPSMIPRYAPS